MPLTPLGKGITFSSGFVFICQNLYLCSYVSNLKAINVIMLHSAYSVKIKTPAGLQLPTFLRGGCRLRLRGLKQKICLKISASFSDFSVSTTLNSQLSIFNFQLSCVFPWFPRENSLFILFLWPQKIAPFSDRSQKKN